MSSVLGRVGNGAFLVILVGAFAPGSVLATPGLPSEAPGFIAAGETSLPVTRAVLYSSGVGYFEHRGVLHGDARLRLMFQTDQINDVLKSLTVADHGGGWVTGVAYPAREPLERALAGFGVNIGDNPSISDLLQRLRGAPVVVKTPERVSGTVFGVESHTRIVGDPAARVTEHVLTLWTEEGGFRSIPLSLVSGIELLDAGLRDELGQALALIASVRDSDRRPVEVQFRGDGEREVQVGYLVEAPVWKTSYRLDLSRLPGPGTQAAEGAGTALLQAWALVENTGDNDWMNVDLSLVSGRPLSFEMDLYTPLYLPRPVAELPLTAVPRPRLHESGIADRRDLAGAVAERAAPRPAPMLAAPAAAPRAMMDAEHLASPGIGVDPGSAPALAEAGGVGELFEFRIAHPVSLPRRQSAMLPIANAELGAQRVSIYEPNAHSRHPFRGVSLENDSGMALPGGPITVYDGGVYAGDAQIAHLAPGDQRLISYAVDLAVTVDSSQRSEQRVTSASLNRGLLQLTQRTIWTTLYRLESTADVERVIVIEQARHAHRELVEPPAPWQSTPSLYRFRVPLEAGEKLAFAVREQQVHRQTLRLVDMGMGQLLVHQSNAQIEPAVREALQPAIEMHQEIQSLQRQANDLQQNRQRLVAEQARIRDNLASVGAVSPLGQRYLAALGESEDRLTALAKQIDGLNTQIEQTRNSLAEYLNRLDVGG